MIGHDESAAPVQPLSRNVRLLGWASCLNDIASEIVYPLLPAFLIGVVGGNRFLLGIIEGVAESVASLLKLASGAWSDRAGGRKQFIVSGYGLAALARPFVALASSPWHVLMARTVDRVGKGLRTSPRDALIAESTLPEFRGRAFGFHRAMDHLGAAIGPLVATTFLWMFPGELRILFLLSVVPGIVVTVMLVVLLRETTHGETEHVRQPMFRFGLPLDKRFRRFLAAIVLFTLGNSSDAFLLLRASELGVPTTFLPLLWLMFHLAKSTGNIMSGRWVDRYGPRTFLVVGWLLYAVVYAAFGFATTDWQAWLLFAAYAGYYALSEPAEKTWAAELAGPTQKGLAFGWLNCAIGISAMPSSLIFGWLYENYGAEVAFGSGSCLALVATCLLGWVGPATTPRR